MISNLKLANSFHWLVHLDMENKENIIERKDDNSVTINRDPTIKDAYKKLYEDFMNILKEKHDEHAKIELE